MSNYVRHRLSDLVLVLATSGLLSQGCEVGLCLEDTNETCYFSDCEDWTNSYCVGGVCKCRQGYCAVRKGEQDDHRDGGYCVIEAEAERRLRLFDNEEEYGSWGWKEWQMTLLGSGILICCCGCCCIGCIVNDIPLTPCSAFFIVCYMILIARIVVENIFHQDLSDSPRVAVLFVSGSVILFGLPFFYYVAGFSSNWTSSEWSEGNILGNNCKKLSLLGILCISLLAFVGILVWIGVGALVTAFATNGLDTRVDVLIVSGAVLLGVCPCCIAFGCWQDWIDDRYDLILPISICISGMILLIVVVILVWIGVEAAVDASIAEYLPPIGLFVGALCCLPLSCSSLAQSTKTSKDHFELVDAGGDICSTICCVGGIGVLLYVWLRLLIQDTSSTWGVGCLIVSLVFGLGCCAALWKLLWEIGGVSLLRDLHEIGSPLVLGSIGARCCALLCWTSATAAFVSLVLHVNETESSSNLINHSFLAWTTTTTSSPLSPSFEEEASSTSAAVVAVSASVITATATVTATTATATATTVAPAAPPSGSGSGGPSGSGGGPEKDTSDQGFEKKKCGHKSRVRGKYETSETNGQILTIKSALGSPFDEMPFVDPEKDIVVCYKNTKTKSDPIKYTLSRQSKRVYRSTNGDCSVVVHNRQTLLVSMEQHSPTEHLEVSRAPKSLLQRYGTCGACLVISVVSLLLEEYFIFACTLTTTTLGVLLLLASEGVRCLTFLKQIVDFMYTLPPVQIRCFQFRDPFWNCIKLLLSFAPCIPTLTADVDFGVLTGFTALCCVIIEAFDLCFPYWNLWSLSVGIRLSCGFGLLLLMPLLSLFSEDTEVSFLIFLTASAIFLKGFAEYLNVSPDFAGINWNVPKTYDDLDLDIGRSTELLDLFEEISDETAKMLEDFVRMKIVNLDHLRKFLQEIMRDIISRYLREDQRVLLAMAKYLCRESHAATDAVLDCSTTANEVRDRVRKILQQEKYQLPKKLREGITESAMEEYISILRKRGKILGFDHVMFIRWRVRSLRSFAIHANRLFESIQDQAEQNDQVAKTILRFLEILSERMKDKLKSIDREVRPGMEIKGLLKDINASIVLLQHRCGRSQWLLGGTWKSIMAIWRNVHDQIIELVTKTQTITKESHFEVMLQLVRQVQHVATILYPGLSNVALKTEELDAAANTLISATHIITESTALGEELKEAMAFISDVEDFIGTMNSHSISRNIANAIYESLDGVHWFARSKLEEAIEAENLELIRPMFQAFVDNQSIYAAKVPEEETHQQIRQLIVKTKPSCDSTLYLNGNGEEAKEGKEGMSGEIVDGAGVTVIGCSSCFTSIALKVGDEIKVRAGHELVCRNPGIRLIPAGTQGKIVESNKWQSHGNAIQWHGEDDEWHVDHGDLWKLRKVQAKDNLDIIIAIDDS